MKSKKLLLLVSILILASGSFAQSAQPPAAKVDELVDKALSAMSGFAYRRIRVVEQLRDEALPPKVVEENTYVFSPPNRSHSIRADHTPIGIVTAEEISIAGKRYTKKRNDPWVAEPGSGGGQGTSYDKFTLVDPQPDVEIEEGKCEPELLNGAATNRCRVSRKYTYKSEKPPGVSKFDDTYWFDQKGLLVKWVTKSTNEGSKAVTITTISYEYDPTIKIEAPITDP